MMLTVWSMHNEVYIHISIYCEVPEGVFVKRKCENFSLHAHKDIFQPCREFLISIIYH